MRILFMACTMAVSLSSLGHAEQNDRAYAGLDARAIASLSAEDIAQLQTGRG